MIGSVWECLKIGGSISGSINKGFLYSGSISGAPDSWKLPYS